MARVELYIDDHALRETARALLEHGGHRVVDRDGEVLLAQSPRRARDLMQRHRPLLMFAGIADVAEAVALMRQGAFGYVLLPLQPGELDLMVSRAAAEVPQAAGKAPHSKIIGPSISPPDRSGDASLRELEKTAILTAIRNAGGNKTRAARVLGIGRNTLWRKIREYNLEDLSPRRRRPHQKPGRSSG
ncbi:MAG TPA: helix-turn-helix domain-containing protein [Candidatus Hydrogenedentes bacterium]|mgnify:CR=1 FL=1|nr:helix-turn-helix domain-containing protein [Candidatus Hydrogenedentota bacterium]